MSARIYINGATLLEAPEIVKSGEGEQAGYYAWAKITLGIRCVLKVKVLGSHEELTELTERVLPGDRVRVRGQMVGIKEHYITCWARMMK